MRSLAYGVLSTKLLSFKRMGAAGIGAQYSWPGILRVELLNGGWVEIIICLATLALNRPCSMWSWWG